MREGISRRKIMILAAAATAMPGLHASAQSRSQDFLIFFDFGQSALTAEAGKLAALLAQSIPETARVTITGHCDTAEPEPEKLGFARANAVLTHFLRNKRMAKIRFNVLNEGASKPLLPTPPNTKEPQNRRVEILVTP